MAFLYKYVWSGYVSNALIQSLFNFVKKALKYFQQM